MNKGTFNEFKDQSKDQESHNDRQSFSASSFEKDIEEEPDSDLGISNSNQIMNMDDRDKAGDPDSDPEFDDGDSEMISIKIQEPR